ncbi:amidohydrolase [bacterium]|nr:amidohydrolase [bacterium]
MNITLKALEIEDWIRNLRRTIHRRPELLYDCKETEALVVKTLKELGVSYESGIAETGVVAMIGTGKEPAIALRADMDALPIQEAVDLPFRSEIKGVMHACGHDAHTAMLLGAARLLKAREEELEGTVKLIFQPAEEGGAGALKMCEAGVLETPKVSRIFGIHIWPLLPTGVVGGRAGSLLASASKVRIVVRGRGGHAAASYLAVDPVVCAAAIIGSLQAIVSRETDPLSSAVVSITVVKGGDAHNVIPERVVLEGTIRSLSESGMEVLKKRVKEISHGVGEAHRCAIDISFPGETYPPTVNDPDLWSFSRAIAEDLLEFVEVDPVMGGEDFSYFAQRVPGAFMVLGSGNEALGTTVSVHHPQFKLDEDVLPLGAALHAAWALGALESSD